jgi:hypothetical protein
MTDADNTRDIAYTAEHGRDAAFDHDAAAPTTSETAPRCSRRGAGCSRAEFRENGKLGDSGQLE